MGDISAQTIVSSKLAGFVANPRYFIIALFLGSPIVFVISLLKPSFRHLFWLAGLSAFVVFQSRYFMWHYSYQIVPFLIYYVMTQPQLVRLISYRILVLQVFLTICLYISLPIKVDTITILPKHNTYYDMQAVQREIENNGYKGGKIGYYMNRPFDEPFPAYEISYMDPSWRFQIEGTEYVVLPNDFVPPILTSFPGCELQFVKTVRLNSIYKVSCTRKS